MIYNGNDLVLTIDGTEIVCDSLDFKIMLATDTRKPTNTRTEVDNIFGKRVEIAVKGGIEQALPNSGVIVTVALAVRSGSSITAADLPEDIQAIINGDYTDFAILDPSFSGPQGTAEYDFTLRSGCRSTLT